MNAPHAVLDALGGSLLSDVRALAGDLDAAVLVVPATWPEGASLAVLHALTGDVHPLGPELVGAMVPRALAARGGLVSRGDGGAHDRSALRRSARAGKGGRMNPRELATRPPADAGRAITIPGTSVVIPPAPEGGPELAGVSAPDAGVPLATLPRGVGRELRVRLKYFEGRPFVDLREWSQNDQGGWWPVKGKGLAIKVRELRSVAVALVTALQTLARGESGADDGRVVGTPPRRG